jgi:hypothetical protein
MLRCKPDEFNVKTMSNQVETEKMIPVMISESLLKELKWLSKKLKVEPTVALRHAIATDWFIQKELSDQSDILIRRKNSDAIHKIQWTNPNEINFDE